MPHFYLRRHWFSDVLVLFFITGRPSFGEPVKLVYLALLFNRLSFGMHLPFFFQMYPSHSPSRFFVDELLRALNEQSYGIETFSIATSSPLQATASVTILEGSKFIIKLNLGGYSIDSNKHPPITSKEDAIFESIEDLLRTASPLYEKKRQEALVRKLEMLI